MNQQQKNLKIYLELIQFFQMKQKEKDMINMEQLMKIILILMIL